jgi:AmiR/NasT family two-component response regulator
MLIFFFQSEQSNNLDVIANSNVTNIEHIQNVMSFQQDVVTMDTPTSMIDISQIVSQLSTSGTPPSIITGDGSQTVQAVTLSDGTTAFIQHPKGE